MTQFQPGSCIEISRAHDDATQNLFFDSTNRGKKLSTPTICIFFRSHCWVLSDVTGLSRGVWLVGVVRKYRCVSPLKLLRNQPRTMSANEAIEVEDFELADPFPALNRLLCRIVKVARHFNFYELVQRTLVNLKFSHPRRGGETRGFFSHINSP